MALNTTKQTNRQTIPHDLPFSTHPLSHTVYSLFKPDVDDLLKLGGLNSEREELQNGRFYFDWSKIGLYHKL